MQDVLQCFHKATESDSWQSRHMPMELQNVLQVLRVPYSPSVWQEAPYLPRSSRSARVISINATFSELHLCCSLHMLIDCSAFACTLPHMAVQSVCMHLPADCACAVAKVQTYCQQVQHRQGVMFSGTAQQQTSCMG